MIYCCNVSLVPLQVIFNRNVYTATVFKVQLTLNKIRICDNPTIESNMLYTQFNYIEDFQF